MNDLRQKVVTDLGDLLNTEERRQLLIDAGWWVTIPHSIVSSHWLWEGEQRLDGGYYGEVAALAKRIVNDSGLTIKPLVELVSDIFILGRFKRIYSFDSEKGWPYLSASEAFQFRPSSDRWIAYDHAPKDADMHFVKKEWILVSASGTVGRMTLANEHLEKYFLTHDLIRIIPNVDMEFGYLYAFLSSWIGQALITKDKYGSAIKHLEPHHISSVPIPIVPVDIRTSVHNRILRANTIREKANQLLDQANENIYKLLNIPIFDENLVEYLKKPTISDSNPNKPELPHPQAFSINSTYLNERLDASFHVPRIRTIIDFLKSGKYEIVSLDSIVGDVVVSPRFKRIYVPKDFGVPLLQGSHLPQIKPMDIKYISKTKQEGLDRWIIRKGWVLVTCSGTIGRIGVCSSYMNGWAASQHILRIIPNNIQGHPGYVAAFLMTPYGQHQLTSKIYGGVVDELTAEDTRSIWIPKAPRDVQAEIGELVLQAFEMKDEANVLENETIKQLEIWLQSKITTG